MITPTIMIIFDEVSTETAQITIEIITLDRVIEMFLLLAAIFLSYYTLKLVGQQRKMNEEKAMPDVDRVFTVEARLEYRSILGGKYESIHTLVMRKIDDHRAEVTISEMEYVKNPF